MFKNFNEMLEEIKKCEKKTVAIAAAHTPTAMEAAISAKKENIANSIFVGDKNSIIEYLQENHSNLIDSFEIIDTKKDIKKAA